jgi:hypothetical protein
LYIGNGIKNNDLPFMIWLSNVQFILRYQI